MTPHIFVFMMALSTSLDSRSGATSFDQEFTSYELCMTAGDSLARDAARRGNYILTWGCFDTGKPVPQSGGGY